MTKEITCVICPRGCTVKVETDGDRILSITGNACPRGAVYAKNEVTNPLRTLTTTMRTKSGEFVPVKTADPVPKAKLFDYMKEINRTIVKTPVEIGDILIYNIGGSGANVVATKSVK